MKAAILAAGLGTRLRPLTHQCPKALVPVLNRHLLGIILAQLERAGCFQAAVNTHHLGEEVLRFLGKEGPWGMNVQVSHEPEILGTGGGLRGLARLLGKDSFLAVNADVLTDLDFQEIFAQHRSDVLATLVLHDWPAFNNVWIDREGLLAGVGEAPPGAIGPPLAYTGVQVVSPRMLAWLPEEGPYDLVAAWRSAIQGGEKIATLIVAGNFWQDLGTPAAYIEAHRRLLSRMPPALAPLFPGVADPCLGREVVLAEGVHFGGGVCLGRGVRVEAGAYLKDCVVWEGAVIAPGVNLEECVVASGVRVTQDAQGQVLV